MMTLTLADIGKNLPGADVVAISEGAGHVGSIGEHF